MLALHERRGNEQVLDIGTGRGLLLIGAARRLATGRACGLDIWSSIDLGGNSPESTQNNLLLERVERRCRLVSGSVLAMSFTDESFDVIVSNLCLHNIDGRAKRDHAVEHIVRVLKPGGRAIISGYKHTGQYALTFRRLGLDVKKRRRNLFKTFPPLTIVIAQKPHRIRE